MGETREKTPEEVTEETKKNLEKFGLEPTQKVEVKDPITGETRIITIDRTGTSENKLILALADPNMKRDQKDHFLSMYLWERGKESASMLVDLMRYKGEHTKETRVFKSQVRFDFEIFANQFAKYIREQSRLIGITLGIDIIKETENYRKWLKLKRETDKEEQREPLDYTYIDFFQESYPEKDIKFLDRRMSIALIEMAIMGAQEGERMIMQIQNIAKAREREKGKGIYTDRKGKIFTYDDPDIDEAVKADREREEELKKETV